MFSLSHKLHAIELSVNLYKRLLRAYPRTFRQEYGAHMLQFFRDQRKRSIELSGYFGLASFWLGIVSDALKTIPKEHLSEWRNDMGKRLQFVQGTAYLGLIIPALFALGNIGFFTLGIEPVFGSIVNFIDRVQAAGFGWLLTLLVVVDPILAILVTLPSVVEVQLQPESGGLAGLTFKKAGALQYSVLAVGLGLMAIFTIYLLGENWLCIVGQQLVC
ncbi:MAG: hypothetical protein IH859_02525 [Chloroflexi bacterium]|nr:hypothetical protein [Chloroflexota bacterium]